MWVPLAMRQTDYLPPSTGSVIMGIASVVGALGALATGLRWFSRAWLRRALAALLVLAGVSLATAATLPSATAAVLLLAFVAAIVPAIVALTWVIAPHVLAGAAAAAGFAVLGMAGTLGEFCSTELGMVRHDATTRCIILALACLVAAWLSLVMDGRMAGTAVSAAVGE
jgi:hypothetical protein